MSTITINSVVYTYGGSTASVTGFTPLITTANIPSTIVVSSVTYNVTSIGNNAFQFCNTLASVAIPNSVTSIGVEAFRSCSSLTSITIPSSVTTISSGAFDNCSSFTSVTIPNSVTIIDVGTFGNCSSLTSVSIPSSVTSIGDFAFIGCSNLNLVYFLQTPNLPTIGTDAFLYNKTPSVGKYYSSVTNTAPISGLFTTISTIDPPTLTTITPFTSASPSAVVIISYANLAANGNEVVVNTPYVFLVNAVSSGSLSIGATQGAATAWNASTNNTIDTGNNAYWTPAGTGLVNAFSVVVQDSFGVVSSPNVQVEVNLSEDPPAQYPCFLEGTKILCFENNEEVYRPVESLRKGDLVKTIYNRYVPVCMMGTTALYNPGNDYRITNRLYKCSREKYPTLFEDLYITGCHSILVPEMTDDQWENTKAVNGTIYVTDNHFRLIACADEKAEPFNKEGFMNIYHIALEHHEICMNYGIYANGLLVESCSIDYLIKYSNLKIMVEEDSSVFQDVGNVPFNMTCQLVDTY